MTLFVTIKLNSLLNVNSFLKFTIPIFVKPLITETRDRHGKSAHSTAKSDSDPIRPKRNGWTEAESPASGNQDLRDANAQ